MKDPDLWLQDPPGSGKPIRGSWGTDDPKSGPASLKYFLNFSNPKTRRWWLNDYVGPALSHKLVDGIYTDCSCGTAPGERFTPAEAWGRQLAFNQAMEMAQAKGKWISSWAHVGPFPISKANCEPLMQEAIAIGSNSSRSLQWSVMNFTVSKAALAGFLIARGSSAIIALPPYDRPMLKSPFSLDGVDLNGDPGQPIGQATQSGSVFKRSYTKAEVSLDCTSLTPEISLK